MLKKRIAVLYGGMSPEREVSLMSAEGIINTLTELGYEVIPIDAGRDLPFRLAEAKPDVVYNALYGTYGEDGRIPGILDVMGIPYTHSGVLASALTFNKPKSKEIFTFHGLHTPPGLILTLEEAMALSKQGKDLWPTTPYVVKPINQGSSVGVMIIDKGSIPDFSGWRYGDTVLVEEYIPGVELSVGVLKGKALGVMEFRSKNKFYDYEAKYTDGITQHILPASIPEQYYKMALEVAEKADMVLGCRGVSRSDFRFDINDPRGICLYLLEVNSHPGMTQLSIVPEIAEYVGISFNQLIETILLDAKCDD